MANPISRWFYVVALCFAATAWGGSEPDCSVCGARLPERYWTYQDQACCSPRCVDELRPHCATCGGSIDGKYVEAEGKTYCSNGCFEKTLPKCEICSTPVYSGFSITKHHYCDACSQKSPTCFSCGLPAAQPTLLADGRDVCKWCMRWAVVSPEAAQKHFDRALRHLEAWTSLKLESVPKLELLDRPAMQASSMEIRKTDSPISIRGLYSRQTFMKKRGIFGTWKESPADARETIYIIDHLHDEVFRVAAVHELMHDLIHEHFKRLEKAPLWVHEGICQQAAAEYCRRRNYVDVLQGIATCTDPDYGDGYRYINSLTGFEGWAALRRWMETVDVGSLPETPPKP